MTDDLLAAFDFPAPISERARHSDRIMAQVPERIPELLERYFGFPGVPHVVQLLQWMFEGGRLIANLPTDHAKSITATFFFPILSLMENPDEAHIICGANANDSKRRLQTIQRHLTANTPMAYQLLQDYPWLRKPTKESLTWSTTQLTVAGRSVNRPDPSIYAAATGSADVMQRRGKLILDDVETQDHRTSRQKREQLYEFVWHAGGRCFEDRHESRRPLVIALGTPMLQDSLYFRLETENWRVLRMPCYTVPFSTIKSEDALGRQWHPEETNELAYKGTVRKRNWHYLKDEFYLWPAKKEKVEQRRLEMPTAIFALQFLLDPSAGDPTRLSLAQIQRLIGQGEFDPQGEWMTFVSIDPAGGSQHRLADYCGISVVRVRWARDAKLPQVQVLEAVKMEQGAIEQVDLVAELAQQYECKVVLETDGPQGPFYQNLFHHRHPNVIILPFATRSRKTEDEMGVTVIRTLIKQALLKVPAAKLEEDGMQAFMREIRDLGVEGKDDHISCSVWFPVRYCYDQVRHLNAPALVGTMGGSAFGGRQALSWRSWRR